MSKKKDKDKVIRTLYSELERLNDLLEKVKEENKILVKTALKASERQKEIEEKLKQS